MTAGGLIREVFSTRKSRMVVFYKAGVGGQGIYILPATDTFVAWFATSDGNNREESIARAIVKTLSGNRQAR